MARRERRQPQLLRNVRIERYAAEGKSVAHFDSVGPSGGPSLDAEGRQIRKVLFVPFAAVGDVADIQVLKTRSSYAEGKIVQLIEPSPVRIEPACAHFGTCGGCKWQHIPYVEQLRLKQQQVMDALTRIGKVALPECRPIHGSADVYLYRNKLEYTFSAKRWVPFDVVDRLRAEGREVPVEPGVGFHIPESFDKVLDIGQCLLQEPVTNEVRLWVKAYAIEHGLSFYDMRARHGLLRGMVVRTASTGQKMLIMIFGEDHREAIEGLMEAVKEQFPQFTSLIYVINEKQNDAWADLPVTCYAGADHIMEEMEGLHFKVGPKSFYQTNSRQAYELYKHVRRMAGLDAPLTTAQAEAQSEGTELNQNAGNSARLDTPSTAAQAEAQSEGASDAVQAEAPLVYDLYTGTGTIANFVARGARHVVGIEYVAPAIDDARVNSAINGIGNTTFIAGDMKDILTPAFIAEHGRPDIIITDPPRAGMHPDVVDVIMQAEPRVIVYVSCNPATQARDLQLLDAKYRVTDIQPVDMFPHTQHVENVVRLELRPSSSDANQ